MFGFQEPINNFLALVVVLLICATTIIDVVWAIFPANRRK